VSANATTYLAQVAKVLDMQRTEVVRNGEWFGQLTFHDVLKLAAKATVARTLERDDFADRYKAGTPIYLHEMLYPLMQGYDSVMVRSDIEIGGTDQTFNLLVGRDLQRDGGQPPQVILTMPIIEGVDGTLKMSKSLGNYIGVTDPPAEMFGKVMSLPDTLIGLYWRLVTDADADELDRVARDLADIAMNPMTVKKRLAQRLVRMYHGADAGAAAQRDFETQFSRGEAPESLPTWTPENSEDMGIKDLLVRSGLAKSGSDAWRAVDQGAVSIDGAKILDRMHRQSFSSPFVLRLGRKMLRVVPAGS
jgi:tyrosyl-tRNA synthetase